MTIYNFSAGPALLPQDVLREAQRELTDWHGSGMSVMEMSHRGREFMSIHAQAEADGEADVAGGEDLGRGHRAHAANPLGPEPGRVALRWRGRTIRSAISLGLSQAVASRFAWRANCVTATASVFSSRIQETGCRKNTPLRCLNRFFRPSPPAWAWGW